MAAQIFLIFFKSDGYKHPLVFSIYYERVKKQFNN